MKLSCPLDYNGMLNITISFLKHKPVSVKENLVPRALAILNLNIEKAFQNNENVIAVFLDITGPFPNVNNDLLLKKFAEIGCSLRLIKFFKFLTYGRDIYTNETGHEQRNIYKGVIQGGPSSSIAYLIYVSEIAKNINPRIKVSQFADDISLYLNTKDPAADKTIIAEAISTIKN